MSWSGWPWTRTREYTCPDGSVRVVYKNIDDVLPLYLGNEKSRYEASAQVLTDIKATLKGQHDATINQLLFKIDDKNMSAQQQLRAAYLVYSSAPCEELNHLKKETLNISVREHESRELESKIRQIQALISIPSGTLDEEVVSQYLLRALDMLTRPSSSAGLTKKMKLVSQNTEEWRS